MTDIKFVYQVKKLSFYRKMNIMGWQIILKCQDYSEDLLGENKKIKQESPPMIFIRTELKEDNWLRVGCTRMIRHCPGRTQRQRTST